MKKFIKYIITMLIIMGIAYVTLGFSLGSMLISYIELAFKGDASYLMYAGVMFGIPITLAVVIGKAIKKAKE